MGERALLASARQCQRGWRDCGPRKHHGDAFGVGSGSNCIACSLLRPRSWVSLQPARRRYRRPAGRPRAATKGVSRVAALAPNAISQAAIYTGFSRPVAP